MRRHRETYVGGGPNQGRILFGGDARGIYGSNGRRRSQVRIYSKKRRNWPRTVLIAALVVIFIACMWQFACGGLPFLSSQEDDATSENAFFALVAESIDSARQSAGIAGLNGTIQPGLNTTITVSAVGDCTFGKDPDFVDSTSFNTMYTTKGPEYFFSNVLKFTSDDDLTIANCEGAFTESNELRENDFNFKGPVEYANVFLAGSVEAVNLSNDHSYDYGTTGYNDTKQALADTGITSFGYDRTATYEANGVKIGLFGVNELDGFDTARSLMIQDIEKLRDEGCAIIIGTFHWGEEGEYSVSSNQVSLAHEAIDTGCDLVLGANPHVLQGIEYYGQRYICYSLGNFCYGGNTNPRDYNTIIFQQTFVIKNGQIMIGNENRKGARVVPCLVSSSAGFNDYQPLPLSGAEGSRAIATLNEYTATLAGDGAEFSTTINEAGFSQVK